MSRVWRGIFGTNKILRFYFYSWQQLSSFLWYNQILKDRWRVPSVLYFMSCDLLNSQPCSQDKRPPSWDWWAKVASFLLPNTQIPSAKSYTLFQPHIAIYRTLSRQLWSARWMAGILYMSADNFLLTQARSPYCIENNLQARLNWRESVSIPRADSRWSWNARFLPPRRAIRRSNPFQTSAPRAFQRSST